MLIKQCLMGVIGLCSGVTVAAGIFAFITMLAVVPRFAARTKTADYNHWYERCIIWGGGIGNLIYIFHIPIPLGVVGLAIIGIFIGVFIGCLAMALAESLRVIPILSMRLHLFSGLPVILLAIAFGKMLGTLIQFLAFQL